MNWESFKRDVKAAGLEAKWCGAHDQPYWEADCHWQIRGGQQLVNIWPNTTKRGFVMQADHQKSKKGTIAKAIKLAGPPKTPTGQAEKKYPASVPEVPS